MVLLNYLDEISQLLEARMDILLPKPEGAKDAILAEAMRYAVFSPGKRLRPFLIVNSANLFGVSAASAMQTAAAIEFIHTYSLIHDDLPSMDDDVTRRGLPCCHIKYDEATAILAGDALLTLAFEVLADIATHASSSIRCELISAVAKAVGAYGMVGGQMLDMLFTDDNLTIDEITRMQRMKTGELFAISCEAGAILGQAPLNLRTSLKGYAHAIGLAFQIIDDLADTEAGVNTVKVSYVTTVGINKSKEQARMLTKQAILHLNDFDNKADPLRELANFITDN